MIKRDSVLFEAKESENSNLNPLQKIMPLICDLIIILDLSSHTNNCIYVSLVKCQIGRSTS